MKTKSLFFLFSVSALLFLGSGCTKIEGPGGAATIKGKIHVRNMTAQITLLTITSLLNSMFILFMEMTLLTLTLMMMLKHRMTGVSSLSS